MRNLDKDREKQWSQLRNEDLQDTRPLVVSKSRDRYRTPLVYEQSRVKLDVVGYINANYLLDREYIATQAPLPSTIPHFWQMVWQEHISLIVMLTRTEENGCIKAHRYWPTSSFPQKCYMDPSFPDHSSFKVELLEKSMVGDQIIMRKLKISPKKSTERRIVIQLQHLEWPDHGCPSSIEDIVELLSVIHMLRVPKPILVHCSAGIGRTGTFITIMQELLKIVENYQKFGSRFGSVEYQRKSIREHLRNHELSIVDNIRRLREGRKMMVQKEDQFKFCFHIFNKIVDDSDSTLIDTLLPLFIPGSL